MSPNPVAPLCLQSLLFSFLRSRSDFTVAFSYLGTIVKRGDRRLFHHAMFVPQFDRDEGVEIAHLNDLPQSRHHLPLAASLMPS